MKTTEDTHEGKQTRKTGYVPDDDKDYRLSNIEIEDAENGVVVNCRYRLKPEIEKKLDAQRGQGISIPYYGGGNSERHVFEQKDDAKKFILGELDELFGTGTTNDQDGDE